MFRAIGRIHDGVPLLYSRQTLQRTRRVLAAEVFPCSAGCGTVRARRLHRCISTSVLAEVGKTFWCWLVVHRRTLFLSASCLLVHYRVSFCARCRMVR